MEIDFPNRRFTRIAGAENLTAGADFDKLNPWGGRKRCILADDGTVLAYRGETGYTEAGATTVELKKTVDGAEKTYASGTKVQVMVEQPVFYVKAVPVSSKNATSGKGKQYTKVDFISALHLRQDLQLLEPFTIITVSYRIRSISQRLRAVFMIQMLKSILQRMSR